MEEIPSYLYPGLAQLQKKSSAEGKGDLSTAYIWTYSVCVCVCVCVCPEVMQKLASWTVQCLSLDLARQSPICVSFFLISLSFSLTLTPTTHTHTL